MRNNRNRKRKLKKIEFQDEKKKSETNLGKYLLEKQCTEKAPAACSVGLLNEPIRQKAFILTHHLLASEELNRN